MNKKAPKWVLVSGGFDPIHIGHVRMLEEAKKLGDKLVVVINNDNWLIPKRAMYSCHQVNAKRSSRNSRSSTRSCLPRTRKMIRSSVSRELAELKPAIFANGGDRKNVKDIPEAAVCKEYGIKLIFNVGHGGKVQSSSWMIRDAARNFVRSVRPWGEFYGWDAGRDWKLKTIYIEPKKRLSLQYHHHRQEYWMLVEGDATATIHDTEWYAAGDPDEEGRGGPCGCEGGASA